MRVCSNGHPAPDADMFCGRCGQVTVEEVSATPSHVEVPAPLDLSPLALPELLPIPTPPTPSNTGGLLPGLYPHADGHDRYWDGERWLDSAPSLSTTQAPSTLNSAVQQFPVTPIPPYPTNARPASNAIPVTQPNPPSTIQVSAPSTVKAKSPGLAMLVSFFLPGVGSMMNGDVGVGVLIFIAYWLCVFTFFLVIPLFGAFFLWVAGMTHAYMGAQKWNSKHGIIS